MQMTTAGLILAAGKGTRMNSSLPKVLHPIAGKSMLQRIVDTLAQAGVEPVNVLLGGELEAFADFLQHNPSLSVSKQLHRLGTGDAVAAAHVAFVDVPAPAYAAGELLRGQRIRATHLLICAGDTPLLKATTLRAFRESCVAAGARLGVLGMRHPQPFGYGRMILATESHLTAIIEEKDADDATRKINICNTGVIFAELKYLFELLGEINCNNAQKEYLLTDCIAIAAGHGEQVHAFISDDWRSFQGVNDQRQLAAVEQILSEHKS